LPSGETTGRGASGAPAVTSRTLGMPRRLRLLDVLPARPLLRRRRLLALGDVRPRLGLEDIPLHVGHVGTELVDHLPRLGRVRDQLALRDVGVLLADQPGLGIPRPALALAGDPLHVPRLPDVLGPERLELVLRPHPDAVVIALAAGARLVALASLRLRPGVLLVRHGLPRGLRLAGVPPGRLTLLLRSHHSPHSPAVPAGKSVQTFAAGSWSVGRQCHFLTLTQQVCQKRLECEGETSARPGPRLAVSPPRGTLYSRSGNSPGISSASLAGAARRSRPSTSAASGTVLRAPSISSVQPTARRRPAGKCSASSRPSPAPRATRVPAI